MSRTFVLICLVAILFPSAVVSDDRGGDGTDAGTQVNVQPSLADQMGNNDNVPVIATANVADKDIRSYALTKREHPWGTFVPGSWVIRRTTNRLYAKGNAFANVSDTKLTLESIDDNRITLRQESNIGIANRTFTPEPQQLYYDFYQQPITGDVTIEQFAPQFVTISRRQVACQVCRYTLVTPEYKKTSTLWYSNQVTPYLLRLEEVRTSIPTEQHPKETVLAHTVTTVTETSGLRLFKNLLAEYKTHTIKKNTSSTTVIDATFSPNIPGGLLREVAVESDQAGTLVNRVETSVLNYFVACTGGTLFSPRASANSSREIQLDWEVIIQGNGGFPK